MTGAGGAMPPKVRCSTSRLACGSSSMRCTPRGIRSGSPTSSGHRRAGLSLSAPLCLLVREARALSGKVMQPAVSAALGDPVHGFGRRDDQMPVPADQQAVPLPGGEDSRSDEHTSELQSLMRTSYAVVCLKKQKTTPPKAHTTPTDS